MLDLHSSLLVRRIMMFLGCLCVVLGVAGLVLPMMPGAFFLFLAAWLFSRSSPRFHDWIVNHRHFGPLVHAWKTGEGFDRALRRRILLIMWGSMLISMVLVAKLWVILIIAACGVGVTFYLYRQPLSS